MCKEYWEQCYERATENLCDEHNIDWEDGEKMLIALLDQNPHYLDGYITYD
jgi:hypothetical protein